jgi:hypothetical protein
VIPSATDDDILKMEMLTVALEAIEKPAAILAKLHDAEWRCPSSDPQMTVAISALCAAAAVMIEVMSSYGKMLMKREAAR